MLDYSQFGYSIPIYLQFLMYSMEMASISTIATSSYAFKEITHKIFGETTKKAFKRTSKIPYGFFELFCGKYSQYNHIKN